MDQPEFSNLDPTVGPDTRLMIAILEKYAPSIPPQAFGQMGFMDGKFATIALLNVAAKGDVTAKSYNAAVRNLKNVKTDMLCKPWYVGNTLPYHIPNNADITVDYKNGKVVVKEKCFNIAPVDAPDGADPRLGEEVQPEYRQVVSRKGTRVIRVPEGSDE